MRRLVASLLFSMIAAFAMVQVDSGGTVWLKFALYFAMFFTLFATSYPICVRWVRRA